MPRPITANRPRAGAKRVMLLAVLVALSVLLTIGSTLRAAQPVVGLGTATSYAVLAGSTITNTGPTMITGDVGLHPGSSVTGFDSVTQDGAMHVGDAAAGQAKVDLLNAYVDVADRGPSTTVATELGGEELIAGVYDSASGTFEITGTLTLDAEGDPDAVFIFQMASTLVTATLSDVNVINGADACNVFWQVGSSATLGTGTSFVGSILALTSITLNTAATIDGRALARNGAVTMDTNTITRGDCATTAAATPAPSPAASPTSAPDGAGPAATTAPSNAATPTPSGSTTSPSGSTGGPSPSAGEEVALGEGEAALPRTGASIATFVLVALGLIVGGLFLRRRARVHGG